MMQHLLIRRFLWAGSLDLRKGYKYGAFKPDTCFIKLITFVRSHAVVKHVYNRLMFFNTDNLHHIFSYT